MIRVAVGALLAVFAVVAPAPSASAAEFGIVPGSFEVKMIDAEGGLESRAGSHPDRLQIGFALEAGGTNPRDLAFEMPPGFGGNPAAVPACPRALFEKGEEQCPAETQVGTFRFSQGPGPELPIFNLEPLAGEFAAFGSSPTFEAPFSMELRSDDYGFTFKASELPQAPVSEGRMELWGIPADHQIESSIPRRPFLTTPTRCGPLTFRIRLRSWEAGAPWLSTETNTAAPLSDCEALPFEPRLELRLDTPVADSPTGARVELSLPEDENPDGRASSQIRDVNIDLPEGVTVSPGGVVGLTACSDAQFGLGKTTEASCPPSSKVGTMEFASSDLPKPLTGTVYLGEERPGERFRLFSVAVSPGIALKFVGAMRVDPSTGRPSVGLTDLPPVPLSRLSLNIDDGPGALLASPLTCGSFPALARLAPYSGGARVDLPVPVVVDRGPGGSQCSGVAPFAPALAAHSSNLRAGKATQFSVSLTRQSGEQLPRRFAVALPPGLSASIGSVETCPDSALASGQCPAGSRIGEVIASVGSGPSTAGLSGGSYLTGPYHGAPFGVGMVFRAALGPFDLGATTVRAALRIDRESGRVSVVTDRFPAVIEGIPIRFREIELEMSRPGFIHNPTSCAPMSVDATVEAMGGASAVARSLVPLKGCKRLGFKPRIRMTLDGSSQLHEHGRPGLSVYARLRPGDANLRAMTLAFPEVLTFDSSGLKEICARRDAKEGDCSDRARVGFAQASTPLLGKPLRGAVYMVQPKGNGLPDLWLSLAGMGLRVNLKGTTSVSDGHLATKLAGLPDMPLSSFEMRLPQGEDGLFSVASRLCMNGRPRRLATPIAVKAQNGVHRTVRVKIKAKPRCLDAR